MTTEKKCVQCETECNSCQRRITGTTVMPNMNNSNPIWKTNYETDARQFKLNTSLNKIVCAATKHSIDGVEFVICDARHYFKNQVALLNYLISTDHEVKEIEQGFIDKYGNFLNRKEAFIVASKAGQIKLGAEIMNDELYSENLY